MYDRYGDIFWGIGPNSKKENKKEFSFDKFHIRCGVMYHVLPFVYAGLSYHYYNYYNLDIDPNAQLATKKILGYNGAISSGPVIHIFSDRTNSVFFPTKGYNFDFKYNYFLKSLGSKSDFWRSELDVRYFIDLCKENVLAFNGLLTFSDGEVPFEKLSLLGGSQICRGIFEGRYRDKNLYSGQVEYRFPIYWRFAGAAFCAVGDVAPKISEFDITNMKLAYGLGLRFIALKKEHVAIRLDVANSVQGLEFYLNIKEAF